MTILKVVANPDATLPDLRNVAQCLRNLADTIDRGVEPHAKGREVNDFSTEPRMPGGGCGWFMPIKYAGQAQAAPTVHDTPGWMR